MEELSIPPRSVLLAPPLGPLTGANREGLHSILRRICEKNQLTVNDVLSGLVLPSLEQKLDRLTGMSSAVHTINRGCALSTNIASTLQELTGMGDLSSATLLEIVGLVGVGALAISRHRKWCPICLDYDLETDIDPHDRLIWSIDAVQACSVHRVGLRSICHTCGAGPFATLVGRDLSGRCPKCFEWLGGKATILDESRDEHSRYILWVAQSFADLLEMPLPHGTSVNQGVSDVLNALALQHFEGKYAHLAKAIERNKSVVGTWLTGRASPSWQALCEVSFTFQVPLSELLRGQADSVSFSTVRRLPLAAAERLSRPRKLPVRRNIDEIRSFLVKVEQNEFLGLLTIRAVAKRLGIQERELNRILRDDMARLSVILAERRNHIRQRNRNARERTIREEVPLVVGNLLQSGVKATRRAVDKGLALAGISVRRREASLIRQLTQLAKASDVREPNVS